MMGTKARLFSPVTVHALEELVPADHFDRQLDRALDLTFVRELAHDAYAGIGRPSIDPVVFFKLQQSAMAHNSGARWCTPSFRSSIPYRHPSAPRCTWGR